MLEGLTSRQPSRATVSIVVETHFLLDRLVTRTGDRNNQPGAPHQMILLEQKGNRPKRCRLSMPPFHTTSSEMNGLHSGFHYWLPRKNSAPPPPCPPLYPNAYQVLRVPVFSIHCTAVRRSPTAVVQQYVTTIDRALVTHLVPFYVRRGTHHVRLVL